MVSWSSIGRTVGLNLFKNSLHKPLSYQNVAISTTRTVLGGHDHKVMVMQPSRWQWHKFKDMFHYYLMVGMIPVTAIIFYCNIFIGPATLTEIPQGYKPEYWEYHRHPITRFIAKYIHNNPQQDYEKFMHYLDEERQKQKLVNLEKRIKEKMGERHDYQAYYYQPTVNKYLRLNKQTGEALIARLGDDYED